MENLWIYDKARQVPDEAKKPITGGTLSGMSNINPMYRIKRLTEIFGPCGTGWWYEVREKKLQAAGDGTVYCFIDIDLYYAIDGKVSRPVFGTGGSCFIAGTKSGLKVSDECYKMALTDAISVAAKALGVAADVYWDSDTTKYGVWNSQFPSVEQPQPHYVQAPQPQAITGYDAYGNPVYGQAVQQAYPQGQPQNAQYPQGQQAYGQPVQAPAQPAAVMRQVPRGQQPVQAVLTPELISQAESFICTDGLKMNVPLGQLNVQELQRVAATTRNSAQLEYAKILLQCRQQQA